MYRLIIITLVVGLFQVSFSQADKSSRYFKLTDTTLKSGQIFKVFTLGFDTIRSGLVLSDNTTIDSIAHLILTLDVKKLSVIYVHPSDTTNSICEKQCRDKSEAIKKHLIQKDVKEHTIITQGYCWSTKDPEDSVTFMILER